MLNKSTPLDLQKALNESYKKGQEEAKRKVEYIASIVKEMKDQHPELADNFTDEELFEYVLEVNDKIS